MVIGPVSGTGLALGSVGNAEMWVSGVTSATPPSGVMLERLRSGVMLEIWLGTRISLQRTGTFRRMRLRLGLGIEVVLRTLPLPPPLVLLERI